MLVLASGGRGWCRGAQAVAGEKKNRKSCPEDWFLRSFRLWAVGCGLCLSPGGGFAGEEKCCSGPRVDNDRAGAAQAQPG